MVLSMEFSRQEYLCGLPFTSPGDLPSPGTEPGSLHCRQILYHLSHLPGSRVALFVLLQESCCCRCSGLHHDHYQLTLPRTVQETSVFSLLYPTGILVDFLRLFLLIGAGWVWCHFLFAFPESSLVWSILSSPFFPSNSARKIYHLKWTSNSWPCFKFLFHELFRDIAWGQLSLTASQASWLWKAPLLSHSVVSDSLWPHEL